MKTRYIGVLLLFVSCAAKEGDFESTTLTSSKGEVIYVNSLNWGMTGDNQMSVISKESSKLKERRDSIDVVQGLDPFIYSFQNDSLKLYFQDSISYHCSEKFSTIKVEYVILDVKQFNHLRQLANQNIGGFRTIPIQTKSDDIKDMPRPSR